MQSNFTTTVFEKELISLAGKEEYIVRGGRHLFPRLPKAFAGIQQIGVIGWSSQGAAQAQNLRESLAGTPIKVKVGLRENSASITAAEGSGFTKANNTLGEMYEVMTQSDLSILLISDAAQAENYQRLFESIRPRTTLGLSHGFLLGYLKSIGETFPENVNVVAVCPKGMGPSVRRLYEQGRAINGAGINASFAIHQDVTGNATDYALGWSVAIGAPVTFQTTLEAEYKSDLVGERGVLLGGIHGIVECLYRWFICHGSSPKQAYINSVESITGPITERISKDGMLAVYQLMDEQQQNLFKRAYSAAYHPLFEILLEIYDEVELGNEIRSVMAATARHQRYPMGNFDTTKMWRVGTSLRANKPTNQIPIHPISAGIYIAGIMAQTALLKEKGHSYSEIANESIIEGVDSLNPYMHHKGMAFINNCSTTARLGTKKWAPRFDYILCQQALTALDSKTEPNEQLFNQFLSSDIHQVLSVCAQLRPPVSISVESLFPILR